MKPYLRNGKPIRPPLPTNDGPLEMYICKCPTCRTQTAYQPLLGCFVPGKTCGRHEFLEHQKRQGASLAAPEDPTPASFLGIPHVSAADSIRSHVSVQFHPPTQTPSPAVASPPHDLSTDPDISYLKNTLTELKRRHSALASNLNAEEFVFMSPPDPFNDCSLHPGRPSVSAINTGPFALEFSRKANLAILEYESWLMDCLTSVDEVSGGSAVLEHRKVAVKQLQGQLDYVEAQKRTEWQRRYDEQKRARRYWNNGVDVVHTGMLFCS